ncbi:MAG: hypothetical protein R2697_11015 [Ilumatobacteraceae bacterium]
MSGGVTPTSRIQTAEDLTGTEAGDLDGAWRSYGDRLPRSRGADDAALAAGYARPRGPRSRR